MDQLLKIAFTDFPRGFHPEESPLFRMLQHCFQVELSRQPDYLFYSSHGHRHLDYDSIRIFFAQDGISPDFNICDYAIGTDYLTLGDRYFRYPVYYLDPGVFGQMEEKTYFTSDNIRSKGCFCGFHYGLDEETPERKHFFKRLSEYRKVDAAGALFNTQEGVVAEKGPFLADCKFSIAFEECSQPGFTTDVLARAFAAQTIPIYWGNPFIGREFNTQAFVNCHDYRSWSDVIAAVHRIDTNDELYLKMMRTPALTGPERGIDRMEDNLLAFLTHIFNQPLAQARRRSRSAAQAAYEQQARRGLTQFLTQLIFACRR